MNRASSIQVISIVLVIAVLTITILGLITIFSVSSVEGLRVSNDALRFVRKQAIFLLVAILCAITIYMVPLDFWFSKKMLLLYCIFIFLGLIAVHIPKLGVSVKGSPRWIEPIPGVRVQPSEFIKIATIILMAWWQGLPWRKNSSIKEGILIPSGALGIVLAGLIIQKDYGSTFMLAATCFTIMITAGVNFRFVSGAIVLLLSLFSLLVAINPVRLERVLPIIKLNFADSVSPEILKDSLFQVVASISAFHRGGLFGQGLGHSVFKEHYIPEYHTDFILCMIGEELGLLGVLFVVILILTIFTCGICISFKTKNILYRLLALGMTLQISLYAFVNTGVVCGALPTKGLAMPFLSYGGSNLIASYIAIGFLLAVAKYVNEYEETDEESQHDSSFWNM